MRSLSQVVIGLNGWGDLVMHCQNCETTFLKEGIQVKSLPELNDLAFNHICDPGAVAFLESLRQTRIADGNTTVA